jgi:hypothetical protein
MKIKNEIIVWGYMTMIGGYTIVLSFTGFRALYNDFFKYRYIKKTISSPNPPLS